MEEKLTINRRLLLVAGLLGSTSLIAPGLARAEARLTVVNVSAWNCPYCVKWTNTYKADWLASAEHGKVRYVEIESPTFKQAYAEKYWPDDLKPLLKQIGGTGTPRFLIVRDGGIVSNQAGLNRWAFVLDDLRKMLA